MKRGSSVRQCGQVVRAAAEGTIDNSFSQARHLKSMIRLMKPLVLLLLIAVSVQAQSLAELARKERERQAQLRPKLVITSVDSKKLEEPPATSAAEPSRPADTKTGDTNAAAALEPSKGLPKSAPPVVDPVQVWNSRLNELRTKIRALQDQEMALLLQQNQVTNQVYAPVTDPATQERALALLGQVQQQVATVRKDLEQAKKTLDAMQLQGPPKK